MRVYGPEPPWDRDIGYGRWVRDDDWFGPAWRFVGRAYPPWERPLASILLNRYTARVREQLDQEMLVMRLLEATG